MIMKTVRFQKMRKKMRNRFQKLRKKWREVTVRPFTIIGT